MPALNFKPQFVKPIALGDKPGTIRGKRKRPIKVGDTLYLFTGMRTKASRKFMTCECKGVYPVTISQTGSRRFIWLDGVQMSADYVTEFAKQDGFMGTDLFFDFFRKQYGLPFSGDWIVWKTSVAMKTDQLLESIP